MDAHSLIVNFLCQYKIIFYAVCIKDFMVGEDENERICENCVRLKEMSYGFVV